MSEIIPTFSQFEWIMTCPACPLQFDIYSSQNELIGYFRLRRGELSVRNYDDNWIGTDIIYFDDTTYKGGYLSQEELDEVVPIVEQKIKEYYGMD